MTRLEDEKFPSGVSRRGPARGPDRLL